MTIRLTWFVLLIAFLALSVIFHPIAGADEETHIEDFLDMSIVDLLQVKIVSASKKVESVFNSPLSASVLTREEIQHAGAGSIMEALRLMPGVIVREQTNGNYDIHIRGLGNVPHDFLLPTAANTSSLVMIDNRIVYNYLNGGTFWESLPVGLSDVDRIEIIRGPSAALYGPNAVSGVINIITRRYDQKGFSSSANFQAGNYNTKTGSGSFGFKSDRLSLIVSGNYDKRDRFQTAYYLTEQEGYVEHPDSVTMLLTGQKWYNFDARYPDPLNAVDKYGLNLFLDVNPAENLQLALSSGRQKATVQNIYTDTGGLPVKSIEYESHYVDFSADTGHFSSNIDYQKFERSQSGTATVNRVPGRKIDFDLEYDLVVDKLTLRPGIGYKFVEYDWVLMGGKQKLTTLGFSLRADYNADRHRLIAAVRGDQYNNPDKIYPSWQLGAIYKIDPVNMVRAIYSRSNRTPTMTNLYFEFVSEIPAPTVPDIVDYGNTSLKLMTMDMIEIGYRAKPSPRLQIDLEIFHARTKDYCTLYPNGEYYTGSGGKLSPIQQYQNLNVKVRQTGGTLSLNFLPVENLMIRPFLTVQSADLTDFSPDLFGSPDSTIDVAHQHDPTTYGGVIVNYAPTNKMNVNLNLYYSGNQTHDYRDLTSGSPFPPPGTTRLHQRKVDISVKLLLNAKVSYEITSGFSLFLNARNLSDASDYETAYSDQVRGMILAGISINQ